MKLKSAEVLLCSIIVLTLCQYYCFAETYCFNTNANDNDVTFYDYTRIAGGQYAQPGQFPYMAVVHRLISRDTIGQCGGTIISSRWVLTAGHCAVGYPRKFLVVFGIIDKSGIKHDVVVGPSVSMITTNAVVHPQYATSVNDIALLYMPHDIPFSSSIRPINLAGYSYESFAGKTSYVIGWGKDKQFNSATNRLKYAKLPIISNSQCRKYWQVSNDHICTAAGLGQDACQGDSGGPLIVVENGQDIQVGIVSYGDGNCPSNQPGVFTRVSSFKRWIESVTNSRIETSFQTAGY